VAARPGGPQTARITAPLACTSLGRGHFEIFLQNGSAALQHRTWNEAGWERRPAIGLPEGQVTAIAAGAYRRGVRGLIAVADGIPYLKEWWQDRGAWLSWADWLPLRDGPLAPAFIVDAAIASMRAGTSRTGGKGMPGGTRNGVSGRTSPSRPP
jgi:hypothetical protein